jgi:drug/metabolite transporter (DMT)-like permease
VSTPASAKAFLAVGLLAASQSGNIIRIGEAPAVAIAAWRLAIATTLLLPLAAPHARQALSLTRREAGTLALAGLALAGHLVTWIAAVQHTTVANAAVVFSANPLLTALGARLFLGERTSPRLALSLLLGLAGVVVMGAGDLAFRADHLAGDALSLACAVLFSAYVLAGRSARQSLDNTVYVTALYGVAGLAAFATLFATGVAPTGYDGRTWLCFGLMALVPTLVGHTSFNYALRWVPAGRLAVLTLTEPALAGAVAFVAWGEPLTATTLAGYGLVSLSVLVLLTDRATQQRSM